MRSSFHISGRSVIKIEFGSHQSATSGDGNGEKMYLRTRVRSIRKSVFVAGLLGLTAVTSFAIVHNLFHFLDPTGITTTYNANGGPIDEGSKNPFFDSLGTNGRSCGTCHLGSDAMGLSVRSIQAKFFSTRGHDPLF